LKERRGRKTVQAFQGRREKSRTCKGLQMPVRKKVSQRPSNANYTIKGEERQTLRRESAEAKRKRDTNSRTNVPKKDLNFLSLA